MTRVLFDAHQLGRRQTGNETYVRELLLPPATGRHTVLTVHDISFERFPEFFSRRPLVRDRLLIRTSARAVSRVVTVSETSRRDFVELHGLPEERVVARSSLQPND
jgi:Glycosyltransferase Family 4